MELLVAVLKILKIKGIVSQDEIDSMISRVRESKYGLPEFQMYSAIEEVFKRE